MLFHRYNVSIGYTVPHDEWHESSVKFIENASKHIYWSNLVQKEYKEVINSIVGQLSKILQVCS